jgi:N-acetylneuraminic acid mutarotase
MIAALVAAALATSAPAPEISVPDLNKGVWVSGPNLPSPRQDAAAAVLGGRIYLVGGFGPNDRQMDTTLVLEPLPAQLYLPNERALVALTAPATPHLGEWVPAAPTPVAVDHAAAAELGGFLYVIGGRQGRKVSGGLWRYDPVTDVWLPLPSMPIPRYQPTAQGVNGKLYVMGGQATGGRDELAIEVYDPDLNQWTLLRWELSVEREQASSAVVDGKIALVGGHDHDQITLADCDLYDPARDGWSVCRRMHAARSDFGLSVVGDRLVAIGGEDLRLDAATQTTEVSERNVRGWLSGPWMPFPRHGAAAVTLGGTVWVIGGSSYSGTAPSASVLRFVSPRVRVKLGPRVRP